MVAVGSCVTKMAHFIGKRFKPEKTKMERFTHSILSEFPRSNSTEEEKRRKYKKSNQIQEVHAF